MKLVVFDNGRLGMVKLEMEQVGLPEFGTVLDNPDLAAVAEAIGLTRHPRRGPARRRRRRRARPSRTTGPVLLDVRDQPRRDRDPAQADPEQGWGFAIAKTKEFLESSECPRRGWVPRRMTNFGYTLMTEQSGPRELVRYAVAAEELGFDFEV